VHRGFFFVRSGAVEAIGDCEEILICENRIKGSPDFQKGDEATSVPLEVLSVEGEHYYLLEQKNGISVNLLGREGKHKAIGEARSSFRKKKPPSC